MNKGSEPTMDKNAPLQPQPACHSGANPAGVQRETSMDASHVSRPDLDSRHSGTERPRRAETESRPSNQTTFKTKSGSIQTQSASTPSEGYSRQAWIPGPRVLAHASRDDVAAETSDRNDGRPARQAEGPDGKEKAPAGLGHTGTCDALETAPTEIRADHNDPRHPRSIPPTPIRANSCNSWTDPYPEETRELINQALSMCVEKFRFPPAARDFVRRAADLGNPFGQYLWGLVLHYDLGEHARAWDYFERSAASGYHDSIRHLALLLEGGHVPLKGASRNPDTRADQIRKAACKLYLKAAELDNYQAKYQYALCCLEGRGHQRNYKEAFRWLQLSACQGHKPAQIRLARLCLDPRQGCHDPLEACVWATLSASEEANGLLADLEASLTRAEIDSAQAEAERRGRILDEKGRLSPEDLEEFERPNLSPQKGTARQLRAPASFEVLKAWQVTDFSQLDFHFYPEDNSVQIRFAKNRVRLSYSEFLKLFSRHALRLFEDHYKSVVSTEPRVEYNGENLAYRGTGRSRSNHKVVSDINSRLRAVFSLPKEQQAFTWLSSSRRELRSLKARVRIEFHYQL